ncbi:MAG: hypothetical protein BWY22_00846 [Bacteroidetes bacterium ADurb.Bin217]|nr:MAG: hypothetical protein BWY22_00846 [Bacteroidetes bacterium ADurb.Bin217]
MYNLTRMIKKIIITALVSITLLAQSFADTCIPARPQSFVYDELGILQDAQKQELHSILQSFSAKTSTQIVVVLVNDLCGKDKAMYATELGEAWGVGSKENDNGIVMLIKPTGGSGQRQTFIAVGYGLEGVIPDAIAKRIVEQELLPHFKQNDIYGGIVAGITVLMKLTEKEYTAEEYEKKSEGNYSIFFLLLFVLLAFVFFTKFTEARKYARSNNIGFWAALFLLQSMTQSHSGSFSNFRSGGGSFGSSGGGSSFGGFGGGSFGGGGAGGSW